MTISAILITKDEEPNIRRCLNSLSWTDEIVVVDSGSKDQTVELSRACGARVHRAEDWPGFGPQKNRALDLARREWVLSIDADEWVTPDLRAQLEEAISLPEGNVAFRMPRLSSYCGRFMRHSGWWPDYVTRLFRRGAARFSEDPVHERLLVEGTTGTLSEPIMHEAFRDLDEVLSKVNLYSRLGAKSMRNHGRRGSLSAAVCHGVWAFLRTYVLRAGFLDGREGFMLAVSNAEGVYYRYLKSMQLSKESP